MTLLAALAVGTERIGLTANTTYNDPYSLARGVEKTWAVWSAVRSSAQSRRGQRGGVDGQAGGEVRLGRGAIV